MSSPSVPDPSPTIAIEITPVEEEEEDLDTLALVQRVRTDLQQNLSGLDEYKVSTVPTDEHNDERNVDAMILLTLVSTAIVASKDLLTSIFNMITATLELLAKKDHVQEIGIIAGGKTSIRRDLKRETAQELIGAFAAQQPPGRTMTLTPASPPNIKVRVSKKRKKTH